MRVVDGLFAETDPLPKRLLRCSPAHQRHAENSHLLDVAASEINDSLKKLGSHPGQPDCSANHPAAPFPIAPARPIGTARVITDNRGEDPLRVNRPVRGPLARTASILR